MLLLLLLPLTTNTTRVSAPIVTNTCPTTAPNTATTNGTTMIKNDYCIKKNARECVGWGVLLHVRRGNMIQEGRFEQHI